MNRLQRGIAFIVAQAPHPVTRDRFTRGHRSEIVDALTSKGYVAQHRDGTYHPTEAGLRFLHDREAPFNG